VQPTPLVIADAVRAEFAPYFESAQHGSSFRNPWPHPSLPTVRDVLRWKAGNKARPQGYRAQALTSVPHALTNFTAHEGAATRVFWIGHASFLLELDRSRFVIDPIFGRAGGLVPRVTPPACQPSQLTDIQAVLVTHGHHDHLDPSALRQIAVTNHGKTQFIVPRGLARALPAECRPVVELDWWQYVTIGGVRVHLVPAQHWHRRGMFDENKSLWGGYVLEGTHRVFHSGDTGYFGGFQAIGKVFGGIDAACLPLGAYEPRWFMAAQHMSPEQSLSTLHDLGATHFVGMHWGAYDLSDEMIEAGPALVREMAAKEGLAAERLHIVLPGGYIDLDGARGATRATTHHSFDPA
jgi:L-ascorbate metabolism protein UlaG (beta-lactamase superfamily)